MAPCSTRDATRLLPPHTVPTPTDLHNPATPTRALGALRAIARALSTAWDLDTTLDLIVRKTTEVMEVDSCSLYLLDPDGQTLRLRATTGLARRGLGVATLALGEGMTGLAAAENRPVFARHAQEHPHFKWIADLHENLFASLLAVPLIIETRPIGALNVQTTEAHTFTAAEVELLALVGDLAAGALAKAQLHDSQQRQISELQTLAEVSELVTSPRYLDDILEVVTDMAAHMVGATACSIFLLDESGNTLEQHTARAPGDATDGVALSGVPHDLECVLTSGRPLYLPDVSSAGDGGGSLLAVPLSVRERVIGVFACYTATRQSFAPEQEALLLTLANQTALAIEHARLATGAAMVREMNHRIKNNLQTVAMLIQLQLADAGAPGRDDPAARQMLQTSMHRVQTIAAVHEVLSERGFHLVDLREVLQRVSAMTVASLTAPQKAITVSVQGERLLLPARVATNVALVVNELVQNALEHAFPTHSARAAGPDRRAGRVEVTLGHSPDHFLVIVRDDGVGLPAEHKPGLGTEIVRTLVQEELTGHVAYRSLAPGTEVRIRLPRELEQRQR